VKAAEDPNGHGANRRQYRGLGPVVFEETPLGSGASAGGRIRPVDGGVVCGR